MKNTVIEATKNKIISHVEESKKKIAEYLETAATGKYNEKELVSAILKELDVLAKQDERLEMLEKYF